MSLHCMHVHELPQIYYELYMSVLYDMYSAGSVWLICNWPLIILFILYNYIYNKCTSTIIEQYMHMHMHMYIHSYHDLECAVRTIYICIYVTGSTWWK